MRHHIITGEMPRERGNGHNCRKKTCLSAVNKNDLYLQQHSSRLVIPVSSRNTVSTLYWKHAGLRPGKCQWVQNSLSGGVSDTLQQLKCSSRCKLFFFSTDKHLQFAYSFWLFQIRAPELEKVSLLHSFKLMVVKMDILAQKETQQHLLLCVELILQAAIFFWEYYFSALTC